MAPEDSQKVAVRWLCKAHNYDATNLESMESLISTLQNNVSVIFQPFTDFLSMLCTRLLSCCSSSQAMKERRSLSQDSLNAASQAIKRVKVAEDAVAVAKDALQDKEETPL